MRVRVLLFCGFLFALSASAFAEKTVMIPSPLGGTIPATVSSPTQTPDDVSTNFYGTGRRFYTFLGNESMSPMDTATEWTDFNGYLDRRRIAPGGSGYFSSTIPLHSGILLAGVRLYYRDENPAAGMNPSLMLCRITFTPSSGSMVGGECGTLGAAAGDDALIGTGSLAILPNATIELRTDYDADGIEEEVKYMLIIDVPTTDGSIGLYGLKLFWENQVSPAPAVASFTDVPTSHPFFKFVEAMTASGITAGCGGGNFCPNSVVTRGQMAVFLASALGLYWAP